MSAPFTSGVELTQLAAGIRARWNAATGTVTHYELYRSTDGKLGNPIYAGPLLKVDDTNVAVGTRYYYTARACNGTVCTTGAQAYMTHTPPVANRAPVVGNFVVTNAASGTIAGGFSVTDADGDAITQLRVHVARNPGGSDCSIDVGPAYVSSQPAGTKTFSSASCASVLTAPGTYYAKVEAWDVRGGVPGAQASVVNATFTYTTAPAFTGDLTLATLPEGIRVSWAAPSSPVTRYEVWRSTVAGNAGSKIVELTQTTTFFNDAPLNASATYYYTVKACNAVGCTTGKTSSLVFTPNRPPVVTGFYAADTTSRTVAGGFTVSDADGDAITQLRVHVARNPGGSDCSIDVGPAYVSSQPAGTKTFSSASCASVLTAPGTYYAKVEAWDVRGGVPGAQASVVNATFTYTTAPAFTSGVELTQLATGIHARWNTATGTVTAYELYRSIASGSLGTRIYTGPLLTLDDTSVSAGIRYHYTARACNQAGCTAGTQDSLMLVPVVTGISPGTATLGATLTFTVNGQYLPPTAVLSMADATCGTPFSRSTASFMVTCTPGGAAGAKVLTVKTDTQANGGTVIDASRSVTLSEAPIVVFGAINVSPLKSVYQAVSFWINNAIKAVTTVVWNFGAGIAEQVVAVADGISATVEQVFTTIGEKTVTATYKDAGGIALGQSTMTFTVTQAVVSTTAVITSVKTAGGAAIDSGSNTTETKPVLAGTLSAPLSVYEVLRLYRGTTVMGVGRISNGNTWTFTPDTDLPLGAHNFTAVVMRADGVEGTPSTAWVVDVTGVPTVADIQPRTAPINVSKTFTVTGQYLPMTAVLSIADATCDNANSTSRTAASFTVVCSLGGPLGAKTATVKSDLLANGGTVIDSSRTVTAMAALPGVQHPTNGLRYEVVTCGTWNQCRDFAIAQGGNLVTIDSEGLNAWLFTTFAGQAASPNGYWIGLYQSASGLAWVSGRPVNYINWDTGEPNNGIDGSHMYTAAYSTVTPGKWNDVSLYIGQTATSQAIIEYAP